MMDYYAHSRDAGALLEKLARHQPDHARLHARQRVAR
jgi:hypothetical protein